MTLPTSLGAILAIIGIILTVVFLVISHLALLPVGLLFMLCFLAILL